MVAACQLTFAHISQQFKVTNKFYLCYEHSLQPYRETNVKLLLSRIWADAKRDGRPAEYRWRLQLNAAVWLTPTAWSWSLPIENARLGCKVKF